MRRPLRPLASALALSTLAAGAWASPRLPALPGPAPHARAAGHDPAADNRACETCHAEIAAEWGASLHHRSWDDPVFLTAYAVEPNAFCRGCHAPESDPAHVPTEAARRLGVGCVTCHVESGEVSSGRAAGRAPHPVLADPRLATAAACEGCHQFEFPRPQHAAMQGTGEEHRASPHAASSCQRCHMPIVTGKRGDKHRSHGFRVSGDAAVLRSAVAATARRSGDSTVVVSLAAAGAGHAVPTGDMFRRLEVRARIDEERGARARPEVLARRFVMGPGGSQRIQIGDDRLPATGETREVRLTFEEPASGHAVLWEVAYQRMDATMATAFGVDPAADEVIVAAGRIPPATTKEDKR